MMDDYNQVKVEYIDRFPKIPEPYEYTDWKSKAVDFASVAFDPELKGLHLPLIRMVDIDEPTAGGFSGEMFILPSYIGSSRDGYGEALSCIGAVLGASLSGKNMRNYLNKNWVKMCEAYYTSINGHGLVLNNVNATNTCGSFWYDIFPSCLFYHIGSLYPGDESFEDKMRDIAKSWLAALPVLYNNWDHTGFNFRDMTTADTGRWVEPDAAIGIAYIEYMAYLKWGDAKFLEAAKACMKEIETYNENPYYEILGSYGPYLAARMNSEEDAGLSVGKFLQFVFDSTSGARPGWGIIGERWGDFDAYGLSGSTTDSSGYGFSMNTYTTAALIAPMVRYAPEYSRAIGRYLLHVSNNSRLYFPDMVSPDMQSDYDWCSALHIKCISYEGVRNKGKNTPYSTGDARRPVLNLNPYGAWGVGFMGALFENTNFNGILKMDVLKTDFEHGPAYPTYLYYNPFDEGKTVDIYVGKDESDVYDCVSKTFVVKNVKDTVSIPIEADGTLLLVMAPAGGNITWDGEKMLVNNVVVDYKCKYEYYDRAVVEMPVNDLALGKPVKASSIKSSKYNSSNVADADWATRWVSGEGGLQWVYVDLQGLYSIHRINLRWYDKTYATCYRIQVSLDEGSWEDIYCTNSGDGGLDTIKLNTPAKAMYVRLCCMDNDYNREYSVIGFEVYGHVLKP